MKNKKRDKNQPTKQTKKPPAIKTVTNVSTSSNHRTNKENISEFLSPGPVWCERCHVPGAWEAGAARLEWGMLREPAACGCQCDPRQTWSGSCCLLEPTKVWRLAGLPQGNPSERHPNAVEPLVCKRFPNTLGSMCPLDWGFQHRHLS